MKTGAGGPPGSSLDRNGLLRLLDHGFRLGLRDGDLQDAVLERGLDLLFGHLLTDEELSGAGAHVALTMDVLPVLILLVLLILALRGDVQVAVLQGQLDLIFLKAGEIDLQLVSLIRLLNIRVHQRELASRTVRHGVRPAEELVVEGIAEEIVKKIVSKDAGY